MKTDYREMTEIFESCQIDPHHFDHADHVGVAYEMLHKHGFLVTSVKYVEGIQAMATKAGAPHKFNMTITLAFLSLIAERVHTTEHNTYSDFISQNEDLMSKQVLEQWYSTDRLQSELARASFLLPDIKPF